MRNVSGCEAAGGNNRVEKRNIGEEKIPCPKYITMILLSLNASNPAHPSRALRNRLSDYHQSGICLARRRRSSESPTLCIRIAISSVWRPGCVAGLLQGCWVIGEYLFPCKSIFLDWKMLPIGGSHECCNSQSISDLLSMSLFCADSCKVISDWRGDAGMFSSVA